MSDAIKTYPVTLKCGADASTLAELVEIKEFPDLGGAPDMLEKTTMKDSMQTYVMGIQSLSALEFVANYNKADYDAVKAKANTHQLYCLEFGTAGADGQFFWWGEHTAWPVGTGTNSIVDMRIACAPSTAVAEGVVPEDPSNKVPSSVTTLNTSNATVITLIDNSVNAAITVAAGTKAAGLLAALKSTDGSNQTYSVTDAVGDGKTGTDVLVTTDLLNVTAEDNTTAQYDITVSA